MSDVWTRLGKALSGLTKHGDHDQQSHAGENGEKTPRELRREIKTLSSKVDELRTKMDSVERVTDDNRTEYNAWHSEWSSLRQKIAELQGKLPVGERPRRGPEDKWWTANRGRQGR